MVDTARARIQTFASSTGVRPIDRLQTIGGPTLPAAENTAGLAGESSEPSKHGVQSPGVIGTVRYRGSDISTHPGID